MTQLLLHNVKLLLPGKTIGRGWLLVEDGRIAQIGEGDTPLVSEAQNIDGGGKTALPGFIDVHVHGSVGYDTMDARPHALQTMARFFATRGVTSFLATTMTAT